MKRTREGFNKIDTVIKHVLDKIDSLYGKKESITGTPSGFPDLDQLTAGFQNIRLDNYRRPAVGRQDRFRAQHRPGSGDQA